jgi:hypothetical protein
MAGVSPGSDEASVATLLATPYAFGSSLGKWDAGVKPEPSLISAVVPAASCHSGGSMVDCGGQITNTQQLQAAMALERDRHNFTFYMIA